MFGSFCHNVKTKITKASACQYIQVMGLKNRPPKRLKEEAKEKKAAVIRRQKKNTETVSSQETLAKVKIYDRDPVDDVYIQAYYRTPVYPLNEIITMHSETLQPAMMNKMNAVLYADMKLDLKTKKKTKFTGVFRTAIAYPHDFDHNKTNRLAVFCEQKEDEDLATELGAIKIGNKKLVDDLFNKHVTDLGVDLVLATQDFYPQMLKIRQVLGGYMPNAKGGGIVTVSSDVKEMMTVAKHSIIVESRKTADPGEATLQAPFARLNMSYEEIYANLRALCDLVATYKNRSISSYITSLTILAPPSIEKFVLDLKMEEFKDKETTARGKTHKKKETEEEMEEETEEDMKEETKAL